MLKSPKILIVLLICLTAFAPTSSSGSDARPGISLQQLVKILQSRESSVGELDLQITLKNQPLDGYQTFQTALEEYHQSVAKYYGGTRELKSRPIEIELKPEVTSYQLTKNSSGVRMVAYDGPNTDSDKLMSWCFNGDLWQVFNPGQKSGPVVMLDTVPRIPSIFLFTGLKFSRNVASLTNDYMIDVKEQVSFSELLTTAQKSGFIKDSPAIINEEGIGEAVQVIITVPDREFSGWVERLYVTTVLFSPIHGFAPIKVTTAVQARERDEAGTVMEMDNSTRFEIDWDKFEEIRPGVWLAKKFRSQEFATTVHPLPDGQFEPFIRNGKPVIFNNIKRWNPLKVVRRVHAMSRAETEVKELNTSLGDQGVSLCDLSYDDGTIIHDERTGKTYQLSGVGAALDKSLRIELNKFGEPKDGSSREMQQSNSNSLYVLYIVNGIFLLLIIGVIWNRSRRGKSKGH